MPRVSPWTVAVGERSAVYTLPGGGEGALAESVVRLLDSLLQQIERESGLAPGGVLVYPLYPSPERFRKDWWQFAILRGATLHGWGTIVENGSAHVSPYQIARVVVRQEVGRAVPLLSWGLGDAIADRLVGIDSHAHARLFLEKEGLPPVAEIVHQIDFSRALPASYLQSVSFLAYLAEEHGMHRVIAFARAAGTRWYDFPEAFKREFGVQVGEAEGRWRARLAQAAYTHLSDAEFQSYRRALEYACTYTLAQSPGRLLSRPGGATAYVEALRATGALRRFAVAEAARSVASGRRAAEQVQRRTLRTRLATTTALWVLGLGPIVLAVLLLAWPAIRDAWRSRRRARTGRAG